MDKDIPPFVKAARYPISYAGLNTVGLRRRGFSQEKINEIKDIYRVIFQKSRNYSHALQIIKKEFPDSAEKNVIISFFEKSERGVMKGYSYVHLGRNEQNDDDDI